MVSLNAQLINAEYASTLIEQLTVVNEHLIMAMNLLTYVYGSDAVFLTYSLLQDAAS